MTQSEKERTLHNIKCLRACRELDFEHVSNTSIHYIPLDVIKLIIVRSIDYILLSNSTFDANEYDAKTWVDYLNEEAYKKGRHFQWCDTPEGSEFWKTIFCDLQYDIIYDIYPELKQQPHIEQPSEDGPDNINYDFVKFYFDEYSFKILE